MSRELEEERRKHETLGLLMDLVHKVQNDEWVLVNKCRSFVDIEGFPYPTGTWKLEFKRIYKP